MALQELRQDFEGTILKLISDPEAAMTIMITVRILSTHMSDEIYLSDENALIKVWLPPSSAPRCASSLSPRSTYKF